MANTSNLSSFLTDVADAIREKKGTQDQIPAGNFDTEIKSIETGTKINNQNKDIIKNGTYTADEGYTGLGTVIVNVPQTGDVPVKLFKTKEEMNSSTGNVEGDLALVYKNEQQNMTADMEVTAITFPETVTLPTAFTGNAYGRLRSVDSSVMFDGNCMLDKNSFSFDSFSHTGMIQASYTSEDGITYTRTSLQGDSGDLDNPVKLPAAVKGDANNWNDNFGYFMQIGANVFEGIYTYKNNNWELAPTQLTAAPGDVYKQLFYGKNGVESGTLGTPDNSFADTNAEIYNQIQNQYENMEPRILTDDNKTIDKNIYFVPVKRDGTPLLDTSNVTNMMQIFDGCTNLTTIPKLNTSNATDMTYMFNDCKNLMTIPLLDTSNVIKMVNMFGNCSNLATIPELNTSEVTYMSSMFHGCSNLTTIPKLNTSKVTDMPSMFNGCENLATVPLLDTSKVTRMDSMFRDCKNLTTIPLLDTSSVTNMNWMFGNCTNLTTIPKLNTNNVTDMSYMLIDCSNLTTIPPELNTSKVTNMENMFCRCSNLATIPLLDTSNVTNMIQMFYGCSSLTAIPLLDTSKVTRMDRMFRDCSNLTTIPELNTSKVTYMSSMFEGCSSLSDDSLNNIMQMCINATSYTDTKTLHYIGLSSEQANKCKTLSNYSAFTSAGWTTGY